MSQSNRRKVALAVVVLAAVSVLAYACRSARPMGGPAAERVYVAPGAMDEFYAFLSGGFLQTVAEALYRRAFRDLSVA